MSPETRIPPGSLRRLARPILVALALASTARAQAADAAAPEEVDAWRRAADRFEQRMSEVHADTLAYAAQRRAEADRRIAQRYDGQIADLVAVDRAHREQAIAHLEGFLERHPTGDLAFSARFRLAELRFEEAQEAYLEASEAYYAALDASDGEPPPGTVEPTIDFSRSIEQYRRIIDDNLALPPERRWELLDGVFVLLGNALYQETSAQRDEEAAKEVLRQLIAEMPESELVDRAYLFLGGLAFSKGDYEAAIREYQGVVAKGPEAAYYYEALYQLAWARFKLSEYEEVLRLFAELLDHSEQLQRSTGKESPVAKDAKRFMAFSFADLALIENRDALEVAKDWFQGRRVPYEREVYVELADVLHRYGRSPERLAVLDYLQTGPVVDGEPIWLYRPENPAWQGEIVDMLSRDLIVMELARSGEERIELTERYGEQSEWWRANRNHPEALAVARSHIEAGLLQVAEEYFVRAQESRDPALYAKAAEKYRDYLDAFPIADDWYDQQWFLANAHKYAGDWPQAAAVFERLFRTRQYHPYDDAALYELMNARLVLTQERTGPPDQGCRGCTVFAQGEWTRPEPGVKPSLPVERTYAAKSAGADGAFQIPVYALSDDRADFIEAAEVLLDWQWTDPDPRELPPNFPDYRAAFEEQRTTFQYLTGQMLYHANRFDEARARLERVIATNPRAVEARYAAGLIVDSHLAEGDLLQVRNATRRFAAMTLGPSDTGSEVFATALEGSTFELANALAAEGRHEEAADAFLAFIQEFPDSESVPAALNNAAYYLGEAGRTERANELYEQFVERFPNHEWTRRHLFVIASNYEATFQLERAIGYFRRLYEKFPDDPQAPDALWEASFLAVGLGRHEEAAKGFERYATRYPDRPDAEDTFWRAGEQWEKVSDRAALAFYTRYRDRYGLQDPDHALQAEARIAAIHQRRGEARAHERQLDRLVSLYERVREQGGALGQDAVEAAAAAEYRRLQAAFEALSADRLTGNEERDAALLQDIKPRQIKEFEDRVKAFVAKYPGAFEWNSGAFWLQARAALYLADLGLSIQCPPGYSEEECWAFQDILDEQVFPEYYAVQDVGVQRLAELVDAARQQGRHSPFIDLALEELNRRDPLAWPAVKRELPGEMPVRMSVPLVPLDASGAPVGPRGERPDLLRTEEPPAGAPMGPGPRTEGGGER